MSKFVAYRNNRGVVYITTEKNEEKFLNQAFDRGLNLGPDANRVEVDDTYICVFPSQPNAANVG